MALLAVRVPDDLVQKLDAWAGPMGGRSPALRRLIVEACGAAPAACLPGKLPSRPVRFQIRLTPEDARAVRAAAADVGLTLTAWVAALVRARLRRQPTFDRSGDLAMIGILRELRAIGVRLEAQVRARQVASGEQTSFGACAQALEDSRLEIRAQLRALHEVLAGNLAYWDAQP
jgi:hypothetical protein